jgi:zinc transport system substrate-binding protein
VPEPSPGLTWRALVMRMIFMIARLAAAIALAAPLLAGCSGSSGSPGSGKPAIVASFYPLQYVTQRIVGDRATVTSLTPPGAEPHDLELTPKDVASVSDADLVVYLAGFQPAVDDAVRNEARGHGENVASAAALDRTLTEDGSSGTDPHFWLDPVRLSAVSTAIEQRLATTDPAGASTFQTNLASLTSDLSALDGEMRSTLATCRNKDLVTSHEAFGYLAERYGMKQVGITGLSPEAEPDPATLARVADFVRANSVRTIYYETLVSPAIANTVAGETGARTAVLDPIEGLTSKSQGSDYLAVMRSNLADLKEGQPCS